MKKTPSDKDRLDRVVAEARRSRQQRERAYREQALKLFPWICARCGREFKRDNVHELTVHHKDHNHDNNPANGSNWELLCVYCHENEHSRYVDAARYGSTAANSENEPTATYKPFADLKTLLKGKE